MSYSQATFSWAKQLTSNNNSVAPYDIANDQVGNVYAVGSYQGTIDLDPNQGVVSFTSSSSNGYVSKLDALGNFVFGYNVGVSGATVEATSVNVDGEGNVIVVGFFTSSFDFDNGPNTTTLTSAGDRDIFILKLDADGNFIWAKRIGAVGTDMAFSVTTDAFNNILTTGLFQATTDFDPNASISNLVATSFGNTFVSKLTSDGNFVWAKQFEGSTGSINQENGITTDENNNVLIIGDFNLTVDFNPGSGVFSNTSLGSTDVFVVKLDETGELVWCNIISGVSEQYGRDVKTDSNGNVVVVGEFLLDADFDPSENTFTLTPFFSSDAYVAKFDSAGNLAWAKHMGGPSSDGAYGVFIDNLDAIYTCGSFISSGFTNDFDPGPGVFTIPGLSSLDIFIQKLDNNGEFLWVKGIVGDFTERALAISLDATGNVFTTGFFQGTLDFNTESGVFLITPPSSTAAFVHKLDQCVGPNAPNNVSTPESLSICEGNSTTLTAESPVDIHWYNASTEGDLLSTGESFMTPVLSSGTYTYYAEAMGCISSAT